MSAFLTARWVHLLMLNYRIDPALLEPFVPAGTVLDSHGGHTWCSLVGFLMQGTRVKGVPVPFHQDFEELNLRFYVLRTTPDGEARRGVVFVKELVPRWAIAAVARWAYNENYEAVPMGHTLSPRLAYTFGDDGEISARPEGALRALEPGSHAEFIAEHYWGYAAQRDGGTVEYQVEHPPWRVQDAVDPVFRCDIAQVYGPQFVDTLSRAPDSAFVAEGSEVSVQPGGRLVL